MSAQVIELQPGRDYEPTPKPPRHRNVPRRRVVRADQLLEQVSELLCRRVGERLGVNLWDNGLGEVAREVIREHAPRTNISATAIARAVGILPEKRRRHGL
jgi:hypothetical protein